MNSVKLYCDQSRICAKVTNENAPTTNRGAFGGSCGHLYKRLILLTITPQENKRNFFMGCYV